MSGVVNSDEDADAAIRLLCRTQTQRMMAENAAKFARMAALLNHELNTPLVALAGAFQMLRSVVMRVARGERIEPSRAAELDDEHLDGPIRESMHRVHDVLGRMQRIANLYGGKTCRVRTDEVIRDVVALLEFTLARAVHSNGTSWGVSPRIDFSRALGVAASSDRDPT